VAEPLEDAEAGGDDQDGADEAQGHAEHGGPAERAQALVLTNSMLEKPMTVVRVVRNTAPPVSRSTNRRLPGPSSR
jgi:hypothetical protein